MCIIWMWHAHLREAQVKPKACIILVLYADVSNNPICNLKNLFFLSVMQNPQSSQQYSDIILVVECLQNIQMALAGCCDVMAQFILVR